MIGDRVRAAAFERGRQAGEADLASGRRTRCPWSSSDPSWTKRMCAHAFWRGYEETHPMGEIDMTGVPEELPEDPNEPEAFTNWRDYLPPGRVIPK